jgi:hypothetical protein
MHSKECIPRNAFQGTHTLALAKSKRDYISILPH